MTSQDEGSLALLATLFAFGIISVSFYLLVLRPILPTEPGRGTVDHIRNNRTNNNRGTAPLRAGRQPADLLGARDNGNAGSNSNATGSGSIGRVLAECVNYPVHVAPSSQSSSRVGGSNMLIDGLLAFRHTRAANYEQSKSSDGDDIATQNRKDRAHVLSRILSLEDDGSGSAVGTPPQLPARGSTIVISVPSAEVACPKLSRVLFLIATHYNLLLILVVPEPTKANEVCDIITQLRSSGDKGDDTLSEDVLPSHRIVASSTTTGRIAFVRQLARTEIILDFDSDVKTQLSRFGYRVLNYKHISSKGNADGISQLGVQLLS